MAAPNFEPSASHELVCGVPGVSFEQNGCYYNIRGEYVKPSGRKQRAEIYDRMPGNLVKGPVQGKQGKSGQHAGTVPDSVISVSKENEKAARAEQAAD